MRFNVKGLIVAPCTPMKEDGSINLAPIADYAEYLSKTQNNENIFILGTTGEGQNLTVGERKLVAEEWMKRGRSLFARIIIHVGAGNLFETRDLALHAHKIKADAIAVAPPTYFKPDTVQSLGNYVEEVAKSVPDMPVLFYHLPDMTGANFPMLDFLDYVVEKVPNFAGIKYVTYVLPDFGQCMRKYGNEVAIAFGKDQAILFAAMMGGTAFVGATLNYMGKLFKEMFDLYHANNIPAAVEKQQDIAEICTIVGHKGNLKALTERISGIRLGPPRAPVPPGEGIDEIEKAIGQLGLMKLNC